MEIIIELNVKKTKEMLVDFSSSPNIQQPPYINGELVESVSEYKYLSTIIDNKFGFNKNAEAVYKKVNSSMFL